MRIGQRRWSSSANRRRAIGLVGSTVRRGAYVSGWSPRAAAAAAHHNLTVKGLATLRLAEHEAYSQVTAGPARGLDRGRDL
jgi:hypothetical protein